MKLPTVLRGVLASKLRRNSQLCILLDLINTDLFYKMKQPQQENLTTGYIFEPMSWDVF